MKNFIYLLVAAAALLAGGVLQRYLHPHLQNADSPVGQPREEFALPDLNGKVRTLSEWDGKLIVLNFWATWCPPCRKEIPDFIQLQEKYAAQGVQFIGVALDETDKVGEFAQQFSINYPSLIDVSGQVSYQFGNRIGALPYSVIIGRDKKILTTRHGEFHRAELDAALQNALHPNLTQAGIR